MKDTTLQDLAKLYKPPHYAAASVEREKIEEPVQDERTIHRNMEKKR